MPAFQPGVPSLGELGPEVAACLPGGKGFGDGGPQPFGPVVALECGVQFEIPMFALVGTLGCHDRFRTSLARMLLAMAGSTLSTASTNSRGQ